MFFYQRPDLGLVVADVLTLCAYDVLVAQGLGVVCQSLVFADSSLQAPLLGYQSGVFLCLLRC